MTEKQAANGSVTTYAYDPRGLLHKLEDRNSAGQLINEHEYSYEAAGNILRWIEKIDGQTRDKQYAYDNLDQLIQASDNGQTNKYRYDAFGNRIEKGGTVSTTYTYNAANQLLEENIGGLSKKYAYDKRGNLLTVTSGSEQLENYTFDETNRLVQAQKAGQTLEYRYTVQGARVQSKDLAGNKTQDFVIDLTSAYNDLLSVYEDNALQDSYTYGLERLHAIQVDGTVETYTYDHLGSMVGLQDAQGNLTETYRYNEFGVLQQPPQSGRSVNFAYTGYPYEANGLYFAQARYYKPEVGRFISEDTYRGWIYNPQSLNRYGYVENNPLKYVDPSGHDAIVITNPALAFGMGHTSLLIESSDGKWSYFYYGDNNVQFVQVDPSALKDLDSFNEWGDKESLAGFGRKGYTSSTYIRGDFSQSYSIAEGIAASHKFEGANPDYHFLLCSCISNSIDLLELGVLYNGVEAERFILTAAQKSIEMAPLGGISIPNISSAAFKQVFYNNAFTLSEYQTQLTKVKEEYENMNWLMKKLSSANFHIYRLKILLEMD